MGKILRFPRRSRAKDQGARPLFPGLIPGATDARPAHFASDASATPDRPRAGADPDAEHARRLRRRRRGALVGLAVVFVVGSIAALFAERGYFDVRRQRAMYQSTKLEVDEHQARVAALKREVERLSSEPRAIERIAREDLGYAAPGEILLLLPDHLDATTRSAIVPAVSPAP